VLQPLIFLGGVFYSVSRLPSPWHEVSHVNPIFYLVQAVRYGFLGTSYVPVAVALGKFLNSDVAPWNYMMATAIIYALPPLATYYAFRHRMSGGLTMGGVKG